MSFFKDIYNLALLSNDLAAHYLWDRSSPSILIWSITNRCNMQCTYCGLPGLDHKELSLEELILLLDEAISSGLRVISLTGGEPMVSPHFYDFVTYARKRGILLSLNTNGLLVEKNIDFIKDNFKQVVVSWDGPDSVADISRGKGTSIKALNAISLLQSRRIKTAVTCVITKNNCNQLGEIIQMAKHRGFSISFQPVSDIKLSGDQTVSEVLLRDQYLTSINELIDLKKESPKVVSNKVDTLYFLKKQISSQKPLHCRGGEFFMRVEPNGDIRKCGRVSDIINFKEVKRNGLYESFMNLQKFDKCLSCSSYNAIKLNFKKD